MDATEPAVDCLRATCSGVSPLSFCSFTAFRHAAMMVRTAVSDVFGCIAQWRGVSPFAFFTFTAPGLKGNVMTSYQMERVIVRPGYVSING